MGLALLLIYVALNLLSPADMFPALAPFHIMLVLGLLNLPLAFLTRLRAPEVGKLRIQLTVVMAFFAYALCAWLPHGYFGGIVGTFLLLGPNVIAYFLGVVHLRTPQRLSFARATMVFVALFVLGGAIRDMPIASGSAESTPYVMVYNSYTPNGDISQTEKRIRGLGMLQDPNNF